MYYLVDFTAKKVLCGVGPPIPPSSHPDLLWGDLSLPFHLFLHFFFEQDTEPVIEDAKKLLPDHDIRSVFLPDFLHARRLGFYDSSPMQTLPSQDDQYRNALQEGTKARQDNKPLADNPYPITDIRGIAWTNGWMAAGKS